MASVVGKIKLWDLMGKHEGKSPLERSRLRWDDCIKGNLNKGRTMQTGLI